MKTVNKNKTKSKIRSSFPENKTKDSISSLRKELIKSRKSGDDLAEALHVYMYVDNDSFGELDPAVEKLETAIDKYSRIEGWFPDDFVNARINKKGKRNTK